MTLLKSSVIGEAVQTIGISGPFFESKRILFVIAIFSFKVNDRVIGYPPANLFLSTLNLENFPDVF